MKFEDDEILIPEKQPDLDDFDTEFAEDEIFDHDYDDDVPWDEEEL